MLHPRPVLREFGRKTPRSGGVSFSSARKGRRRRDRTLALKGTSMTKKGVDRKRFGGALAGALALLSAASPARANDSDAAFRELKAEVPGLRADWNFETGYPDFIYGKPIRRFGVPADDAGYEAAARQLVDTYPALFGFDSSVLSTDFVKHIELSRIGTTDKTAVQFSQWVNGLPVKTGTLNVLFNVDGA